MEFKDLGSKYKDQVLQTSGKILHKLEACILMEILEELKLLNANFEPKKKTTTITKK